jgi:fatty acid desaturase
MKPRDLIDLLAVVLATAMTAFIIVACWSLFGGLVTYIIALLVGVTLIYVWSDNHEDVSRDTDV